MDGPLTRQAEADLVKNPETALLRRNPGCPARLAARSAGFSLHNNTPPQVGISTKQMGFLACRVRQILDPTV
jgi:hypothetical protein